MLLLDKEWEDTQIRTFTNWVNARLALAIPPATPINDLQALNSGVVLIQLLQVIGETNLGRYNKAPRNHFERIENVNRALEFIKVRGVNITNIGGEDIAQGNLKLILGLIWTIIMRFTIRDISVEGLTARDGLLLWCQRKTQSYQPDVRVLDFSNSWKDGLAFCALIHFHRPDLLDFHRLDKTNARENTALAFEVAEKHIGITKLLEVSDLVDSRKPDERSVMTYVAQYFHAFSSLDRRDTAARRVAKFAEVMHSAWESENSYETRVEKLIDSIEAQQQKWKSTIFEGTYADTRKHANSFTEYKTTLKRTWITEKRDLDALLGNIQTKLKTYRLVKYIPPNGLSPQDLEDVWTGLERAEVTYRALISKTMNEAKARLMKSFADQAQQFQESLNQISIKVATLDGNLQVQLQSVKNLQRKIAPLEGQLKRLEALDRQCQEALLDDLTVLTLEDLQFDLTQIVHVLTKKAAFIENQMVARNMTNLTPAQLEEFESSFRYFDKDAKNALDVGQFKACLASLGLSYSDDVAEGMFRKASSSQQLGFEPFINLMVSITEDQTTPEQLRESFQVLAGDKGYLCEADLQLNAIPGPIVQYLKATMPLAGAGDAEEFDYVTYLDLVFT